VLEPFSPCPLGTLTASEILAGVGFRSRSLNGSKSAEQIVSSAGRVPSSRYWETASIVHSEYPAVVSVNASPRVWGADRVGFGAGWYSLMGEGAACDVAEFERLIEESVGE
jgi:hypothetical protein